MDELRPDPDRLLAAVQKDEARRHRGKLKIFLGMSAGVGKTYSMLQAAQQLRAEGVDVVVGYVETHRRAETDALLNGLEVIPRQEVEYRGATLAEMSTDAILARQPQVVLVDELAHTNAPGMRHLKRYQDVTELLESGMTVYTTINVQHFESRADSVRQITGITVHETVPDSVLDLADEIELIDLSPEDLRKRLAEGKVYTSERVETASQNFFRVGNLTALREMALRLTAERVDHQLQDYMEIKHIAGPWKSGERLMVAIGPSPFSARLIRWTRRMAYNLEAPWIAVYVETSALLSDEQKEQLAKNVALARELGGEIVTASGGDVVPSLLRLAHQRNITQIVMGKPQHTRLQMLLRGGSLVDQVIRASGDIDVYVVSGDASEALTRPERNAGGKAVFVSRWQQYLWATLMIVFVTVMDFFLVSNFPWIGYQIVGLTELLAVLLVAVYFGRGPALLAAALSALLWDVFFIEPRMTFSVSQPEDFVLLVMYFLIALFAGNLTARIRDQERQAQRNAERTMALYTLARETSTDVSMDDVLATAVQQIGQVFEAEVSITLSRNGVLYGQAHPCSTLVLDTKELSVAQWVFDNGKTAGRFTETLPLAGAQHLPLLTPGGTVGVLSVGLHQQQRLSVDQEVLLETFVNQVALVIQREMLDSAAEEALVLRESERLYTTLLNTISHELRTPIATIMGASSSLLNPQNSFNPADRNALTYDIELAANRLNRLVENLLDMSRLDSGRLTLKREWCDVNEIIAVAVRRMNGCNASHPMQVTLNEGLPLLQLDFVLIEQVLVNLLDNACAYTPEGALIRLSAEQANEWVRLTVTDSGAGIPIDSLERVFDKFYRVPGTASGGTGLGLSVSRGLVEAHGGTLHAERPDSGGTRFILLLPIKGAPPPVTEVRE